MKFNTIGNHRYKIHTQLLNSKLFVAFWNVNFFIIFLCVTLSKLKTMKDNFYVEKNWEHFSFDSVIFYFFLLSVGFLWTPPPQCFKNKNHEDISRFWWIKKYILWIGKKQLSLFTEFLKIIANNFGPQKIISSRNIPCL